MERVPAVGHAMRRVLGGVPHQSGGLGREEEKAKKSYIEGRKRDTTQQRQGERALSLRTKGVEALAQRFQFQTQHSRPLGFLR